jgi:hypothetical protein
MGAATGSGRVRATVAAVERARWPRFGAAAGVAVGVGLAVALVATGALRVPVHRDDRDASTDFLQAWSRSRQGTFVVESEFRRRLADGRTLFSASRLVQRPPDRIVRQFGGIDGTVNGHPIVCSTDQAGRYSCFAGSQTVAPYDQVVAREVATFRSYFDDPVSAGSTSTTVVAPATSRPGTTAPVVEQSPAVTPGSVVRPSATSPTTSTPPGTGTAVASSAGSAAGEDGSTSIDAVPPGSTAVDPPGTVPQDPIAPIGLYRVGYAPDPGCFEFFQKSLYPDPPYGSYAKFCFDAETGAMTQLERRLANDVVESLKAVKVVPQVSPIDLDTAADSDYEMRMDLGGFEPPTIPPAPGGSTPPTTAADPEAAAVATASNAALISDGSARVDAGSDASAFVDEALRRLRDGRLSVNAAEWTDRGQLRALTQPVVLSLLAADIYLPPPPPARARG